MPGEEQTTHREKGKQMNIGRRKRRERLKLQRRRESRREKKRLLGFFAVGCAMFLIGAFAGGFYVKNMDHFVQAASQEPVESAAWEGNLQAKVEEMQAEILRESQEKAQREKEQAEEQEENLPTDWNLRLVNRTHPLPENYEVELGSIGGGHQLDVRIVDEYKKMILAARAEGVYIYVSSSYRSMLKQVELHHDKILDGIKEGFSYDEAKTLAATVVAVPGTSEHQLGLAVDLVSSEYRRLDEKQENTKGFQWLKEHCWEYGFILRYPNGRTDITGIIYEPWHFRYVGEMAAKEIMEKGITLEEYLGALPVSAEQ